MCIWLVCIRYLVLFDFFLFGDLFGIRHLNHFVFFSQFEKGFFLLNLMRLAEQFGSFEGVLAS